MRRWRSFQTLFLAELKFSYKLIITAVYHTFVKQVWKSLCRTYQYVSCIDWQDLWKNNYSKFKEISLLKKWHSVFVQTKNIQCTCKTDHVTENYKICEREKVLQNCQPRNLNIKTHLKRRLVLELSTTEIPRNS